MSDISEISQLVAQERQFRVRFLDEELLACFHEDATVETSWMRGSAAAFAAAGRRPAAPNGSILNRLGTPIVELRGRKAHVELPSTTSRWLTVHDVEAVMRSYMRILYRVERRDGPWKIASLLSINERETLDPAVPGTELRIDPRDLEGLRVSYRYRAYTRGLDGITVSQDLLGTDRPDGVQAAYDEAEAWLAAA